MSIRIKIKCIPALLCVMLSCKTKPVPSTQIKDETESKRNSSNTILAHKYPYLSVLDAGAKGDGKTDDTKAIQFAVNNADTIYFPAAKYLLTSVDVPPKKYFKSDGYTVTIIQKPAKDGNESLRMFWLKGSDITFEPMTYLGNIEKDRGEQNHAIFCYPGDTIYHNIYIKGARGKNLRGDVVCMAGLTRNAYIHNLTIENIEAENCYRNAVSVTAGVNVIVRKVFSRNSGLYGIDIEKDPNEAPLMNITIDSCDIERLGVTGDLVQIENVVITNCIIDGKYLWSNPPHQQKKFAYDCLVIRDAKNISFKNVIIKNAPRMAIWVLIENSRFKTQNLSFDNLQIENANAVITDYPFMTSFRGAESVRLNNIKVLGKKNKEIFDKADIASPRLILNNLKVHRQ